MRSLYSQRGYTLIELMIAIVLGLLISAAALQIFYTSTVSSNIQQAGSDVVDTGTFGFNNLTKNLRRANHGSVGTSSGQSYFLNASTPQGGIVLSKPTNIQHFGEVMNGTTVVARANNLQGLNFNNGLIPDTWLSQNASTQSGSNVTAGNSDQLTIQYQAYEDTVDCQGNNVKKDDFVLERYFVRPEDPQNTNSSLALACTSVIYTYDKTTAENRNGINVAKRKEVVVGSDGKFTNGANDVNQLLTSAGNVIIRNVDYFKVKLGVSASKDFATNPNSLTLENINIPATTGNPSQAYTLLNNKRIVQLQVAVLIRSTQAVTASNDPVFDILGEQVRLKQAFASDGKMRRVLQSTILMRNARGTVS